MGHVIRQNLFSLFILLLYPDLAVCKISNFKSLSVQKAVPEIFAELFSAAPVDENDYLVGKKLDGSRIALPIKYSKLKSSMGVEGEYGKGADRGKFVLIIEPGQSALTGT